jgi:hypothetical protein
MIRTVHDVRSAANGATQDKTDRSVPHGVGIVAGRRIAYGVFAAVWVVNDKCHGFTYGVDDATIHILECKVRHDLRPFDRQVL